MNVDDSYTSADWQRLFEAAILTLAQIDEALGLPDDGCNSPQQTLEAIEALKKQSSIGQRLAATVMADQTGKA